MSSLKPKMSPFKNFGALMNPNEEGTGIVPELMPELRIVIRDGTYTNAQRILRIKTIVIHGARCVGYDNRFMFKRGLIS